MEVREVLNIALLSGEILLTSGSEIYRVEDTIDRICSAYHIECESFVTPSGIFVTGWPVNNTNKSVSLIKRIRNRSINLHNIELINTFSRNLQSAIMPYDEALKVLKSIKIAPYFSFINRLFAAGLTSFAYAVLFKGTFIDSIIAAAISMFIYFILEKMKKADFSPYFNNFLCSLTAGLLSLMAGKLIGSLNVDSIIVGSIMILVPGLAITNGIRDALHGDILSSQARVVEAMIIVTAIGVGMGIALLLMRYWM
ncbi:MAG: threonine/serine exporter family protein [Clostridia bacterium]|nr:threonine/serine exporter family protein [Clostridia bacterium]